MGWVGDAGRAESADDSLKGRLALTVAPPVLPTDGASHPIIHVQLQTLDGSPMQAVSDVKVSLISSDSRIGKVPQSVEIQTGHSFAVASMSTTAMPGTVILTAVSADWEMATAEVTTLNSLRAARPYRVTLHASPPKMIVGATPPGLLSVVLQGANGIPVVTDRDLVVELEVSAPNVVGIAATTTIPANSYFATMSMAPVATGTAVLTAVSAGFVSEFMAVHVVEPGDVASSLAVYVSPPILRSGIEENSSLIVQAMDEREIPVDFPCQEVKLSSSYPSSANASSSLSMPCDTMQQFAATDLEVGTAPGTPTIVVAGTGLTPASTGVTVHGQTPAKLRLYTAPSKPLAVDMVPGYLVVQLVDHNDVPVTMHRGVDVSFQGVDVARSNEAYIPPGSSFTRVELIKPETSVPKAMLWSIGDDLATAQASIEIHSVSMNVLFDKDEGPAFVDQPRIVVVSVKSAGVPVGQAQLNWSADVGLITEADPYTNDRGEARATYIGQDVGDVKLSVEAIKEGFSVVTTEAEISVVQAPPSTSDQPALFGVPVSALFVLALIGIVGYAAMSFRGTLGTQFGKLLKRNNGEDADTGVDSSKELLSGNGATDSVEPDGIVSFPLHVDQ
jgi:hypothetical protein